MQWKNLCLQCHSQDHLNQYTYFYKVSCVEKNRNNTVAPYLSVDQKNECRSAFRIQVNKFDDGLLNYFSDRHKLLYLTASYKT